jgi:hypothetical protein
MKVFQTKFADGLSAHKQLFREGKLMRGDFPVETWGQLPQRIAEWAIGELQESSGNATTPVWGAPLVWVWKHTFHPKKPKKSLATLVRPSVLVGLTKLYKKIWGKEPEIRVVPRLEGVSPAALPLYGKEFESGRFKVSLLKEVKQGSVLVGTFANLTGSVMWFEKGEYCGASHADRTMKLELICNDENWFVSVTEPSTCVYEGVFGTPIACTGEQVKEVKGYKLKKLEQMAEFFHIPS